MKRIFIILLAIILIAGVILTGCTKTAEPAPAEPSATPAAPAATEPEETIELKWLLTSQGYNEFNWDWQVCMGGPNGWATRVEEATGGRVHFNYLVGAVTFDGMYDSLAQGAGDIAEAVVLINTGRFPVLELMTIPDFFGECQRPSKAAYEFWQSTPEIADEFSEAKLICVFATVPSPPGIGFATLDKPVTTLEDMKGMKMGCYGKWATKEVEALGFTPVAVPQQSVYENLQRGIVDGSFMATNYLTIQNVGELNPYWHPITFQFCPFWLSMNWDTWNSLPEDIQKIMTDLTPDIPDGVDNQCRTEQQKVLDAWPDVEIVEIAPEEQERWKERQDPVQAEYIAELDSKGMDGQAIFDNMEGLLKKYAEAPAQ